MIIFCQKKKSWVKENDELEFRHWELGHKMEELEIHMTENDDGGAF